MTEIDRIMADIRWKQARLWDAQEHSIIVRLEREIAELQRQLLQEKAAEGAEGISGGVASERIRLHASQVGGITAWFAAPLAAQFAASSASTIAARQQALAQERMAQINAHRASASVDGLLPQPRDGLDGKAASE